MMIATLTQPPEDSRRRRQHFTRQRLRIYGWRDLANRHRRHSWHEALRGMRGMRVAR